MRPALDVILRFRPSERHLHWAIAVPFMVCYVTALVLVAVYNPNPARPFREVVSWIHRLSGLCLLVLPLWMITRHRRDLHVHLKNIRHGWVWSVTDLKWLFLMGLAMVRPRTALPHQGKFNAGEKINFMAVMAMWPVYVVTGLAIWFTSVPYLAWLIHFSMAVAATPLVLGHIFMATVNPDTRVGLSGMLSGFVDREWARHHYRLWYDEQSGARPAAERVTDRAKAVPATAPAGPIARAAAARTPSATRRLEDTLLPALTPRPAWAMALEDLPVIAAPRDIEGILRQIEREAAVVWPGADAVGLSELSVA